MRAAQEQRTTKETQVLCKVELDGQGVSVIDCQVPFLSHMLEQFARFSHVDLELAAHGDVNVDPHHLVEDVGIVLGRALSNALGERNGIRRFGAAYAPLDESLVRVVLDLSRRPYLEYHLDGLKGKVGQIQSEVLEEFWKGLAINLEAAIHVDQIRGRNRHHIAEASFKALGLAFGDAICITNQGVPSTKGIL